MTYDTVYIAYRSRFDKKKLFETEDEAKAFDFAQAKAHLGLSSSADLDDLEYIYEAVKVLHDAIRDAERKKLLAEYAASQKAEAEPVPQPVAAE